MIKNPAKFLKEKTAQANEEKKKAKQIDAFINAAPDGKKVRKLKGKKVVITHTIYPEDLDRLDDLAKENGLTRAGLINFLIKQALNKGEL